MGNDVDLQGYVYDAEGDAKSGLEVNLYNASARTVSLADTTTNSAGLWKFNDKDSSVEYDVKITDGTKNIWINANVQAQISRLHIIDELRVYNHMYIEGGDLTMNVSDEIKMKGQTDTTARATLWTTTGDHVYLSNDHGGSLILATCTVAGAGNDTGRLTISGGADRATAVFEDTTIIGGANGTDQGILKLWDGAGGVLPAYIWLHSPDGSAWYLFVEDDGTVKVHNAAPTQNSDGSAIGGQS